MVSNKQSHGGTKRSAVSSSHSHNSPQKKKSVPTCVEEDQKPKKIPTVTVS